MTFLRRLIRGDVSLPLTFWLGFILTRVLLATAVFYAQRHTPGLPARIFAGIFLLYDILIFIATWRSATAYLNRNSATIKRVWGYAAKLAVAAMIIMIAVQLFNVAPKLLGKDTSPESGVRLIIHDEPDHGPMTESPVLDSTPTPIAE